MGLKNSSKTADEIAAFEGREFVDLKEIIDAMTDFIRTILNQKNVKMTSVKSLVGALIKKHLIFPEPLMHAIGEDITILISIVQNNVVSINVKPILARILLKLSKYSQTVTRFGMREFVVFFSKSIRFTNDHNQIEFSGFENRRIPESAKYGMSKGWHVEMAKAMIKKYYKSDASAIKIRDQFPAIYFTVENEEYIQKMADRIEISDVDGDVYTFKVRHNLEEYDAWSDIIKIVMSRKIGDATEAKGQRKRGEVVITEIDMKIGNLIYGDTDSVVYDGYTIKTVFRPSENANDAFDLNVEVENDSGQFKIFM